MSKEVYKDLYYFEEILGKDVLYILEYYRVEIPEIKCEATHTEEKYTLKLLINKSPFEVSFDVYEGEESWRKFVKTMVYYVQSSTNYFDNTNQTTYDTIENIANELNKLL